MGRLVLVKDGTQPVSERTKELVAGLFYLAAEIRRAADVGDVGRLRTESDRLANLTRLLQEELRDRRPSAHGNVVGRDD